MVLAMTALDITGQKQTESALDTLASQGVLGSLCVLLIIALFFTIKALLKAKDDRFTDQKLMTEALERHNLAAKELAIEMNKASSNMVNEVTKTLEILNNTLEDQERQFNDVIKSSMELRAVANNFRCSGGRL
jgi:hypothetical protein